MSALPALDRLAEHHLAAPVAEPKPRRVAVLIPAYNAGDSINQAVASLVNGTYPCDIYIVDDGSAVPVAQILDDFPGVTVIRLDKNTGVVNARNVGLEAILKQPYDYVACLDADDVSYPDRIASQVAFLDDHPAIAAIGGWLKHFDKGSGRFLFVERTPHEPAEVKRALNYNTAISQTTLMARAAVLRGVGPYSDRYPVAEDYELFRRIAEHYPVANIPQVVVDRYLSRSGLSLKNRRRQVYDRFVIQLRYFAPAEPSAWLGLAKTAMLFVVPEPVSAAIKEWRGRS